MTTSLLFPELAPDAGFAFPEPLSDKYRPRRIADFAGLSEPKKILAGFASNRFLSRNRVLNFSTYAIQTEAAELLESVWTKEASPETPKPNFARLIKDATGNIRAALASLETRLDAARA